MYGLKYKKRKKKNGRGNMKNVENKEGFIKLNKIKKKSTKIYKKDPQNRSFGNGRFI
jgi:hypothetical protein